MQGKVSTPVGISIVVVALLVVGFVFWRSMSHGAGRNEKGIPRDSIPESQQAGMNAMKSIPVPGMNPGGGSAPR